jgi:arylsulfatase A-like enzyme
VKWKILIVLILAVAASTSFFYYKNHSTGAYLFRLMDHLPQIEFVRTQFRPASKQGEIIKSSEAATQTESIDEFVSKFMNHDLMKESPLHPLKLKITKPRMGRVFRIGLRTENVLFAPPPTVFRASTKLGPHPVLRFGYSLINELWDDVHGTASFRIIAEDLESKSKKQIFRMQLNPDKIHDRGWIKEDIDLRPYANKQIRLTFETSASAANKNLLSAWINPVIIDTSASPKKLNVILISIDTLRSDHLSCYGYAKNTTPHIDQLAKKGVIFRNTIAQAPYTMSSHMSLLTSLYPSFHGVNKLKESYLNSEVTTLAEALYNEAYRTWAIVGGGQLSAGYGFAEGFETFIEYNHKTDVQFKVDETIEFLEKEKHNNFFVFFHTFRPHAPYKPPAPYKTMFDSNYAGYVDGQISTINAMNDGKIPMTLRDVQHLQALYDGEIRQTDDALAPLFEYLHKTGLDENTLVVITSDHGEEFAEHGKVGLHSHTLYDELLRVPLIMVLPGTLPKGLTIDNQVRSIDIAPTILETLQIHKVDSMQGTSLVNLMETGVANADEKYAYSERLPTDKIYLRSARTSSSKFIYEEDRDDGHQNYMQFDLKGDPKEQHNLYSPSSQGKDKFMSQIQFLIQKERNTKAVARRQELDPETVETLKALGYIN